jgi:hypothetical protein
MGLNYFESESQYYRISLDELLREQCATGRAGRDDVSKDRLNPQPKPAVANRTVKATNPLRSRHGLMTALVSSGAPVLSTWA